MSIYRRSRPRWRATAATAAVCLVAGGAAGWIIGSGSEPDPVEAVRSLRSTLAGVGGALEVVDIEYSEAVDEGEVVAESEYRGARAAAVRARSLFTEVRQPLALLAPDPTSRIQDNLDALVRAIDSTADEEEVAEIAATTSELIADFGAP
jgi:hypothetical protein